MFWYMKEQTPFIQPVKLHHLPSQSAHDWSQNTQGQNLQRKVAGVKTRKKQKFSDSSVCMCFRFTNLSLSFPSLPLYHKMTRGFFKQCLINFKLQSPTPLHHSQSLYHRPLCTNVIAPSTYHHTLSVSEKLEIERRSGHIADVVMGEGKECARRGLQLTPRALRSVAHGSISSSTTTT